MSPVQKTPRQVYAAQTATQLRAYEDKTNKALSAYIQAQIKARQKAVAAAKKRDRVAVASAYNKNIQRAQANAAANIANARKRAVLASKPVSLPSSSSSLEHYQVLDSLAQDLLSDGIDVQLTLPSEFSDLDEDGYSEYDEAFVAGNDFDLNIVDLTGYITFTEKYIDTVPVWDAEIDLPSTGDYSSIQVRIVEL